MTSNVRDVVLGMLGIACIAAALTYLFDPAKGKEWGPCYGNQTCNAPLSCVKDKCVDLGSSDGGVP